VSGRMLAKIGLGWVLTPVLAGVMTLGFSTLFT
jgi:phosphate/sulfate permease